MWLKTGILLTIGVIGFLYAAPKSILINVLSSLYPTVLFRKRKDEVKKKVYLTIDDVPYGYHEEIYHILKKHDVKATFFVISNNIERSIENRDFLIRAVKDGFHLANHGVDNKWAILKSNQDLGRDIWRCNNMIESIYQDANEPFPVEKYYRPGSGFFNDRMVRNADINGHILTLGSIYAYDIELPFIWLSYIYLTLKIEDGDIIIVHDRKSTINMLDRLIPWLKRNGYECCSLVE